MHCKRCDKEFSFITKEAELNWVQTKGVICYYCRDFEIHGIKHEYLLSKHGIKHDL